MFSLHFNSNLPKQDYYYGYYHHNNLFQKKNPVYISISSLTPFGILKQLIICIATW